MFIFNKKNYFYNVILIFYLLSICLTLVMGGGQKKILEDSQVYGGKGRRNLDVALSEKYGGYRAEKNGEPLSSYGKYVEPVLHSMEHSMRAVIDSNPKEWARAKDEMKSVGKGLNHIDPKYQNEFKKK
ncbi:hypothetical protein RB653_009400 [Dictyostelium firmibasis]|uniref:Uncharacterized protein n=1 Tax=Dictyostelium firmibasis TaxID=79012 RepID=A0AAN7TU07_9MYCE